MAAVVAALLAGCGGSSSSPAPAAVASPSSTVVPHRGGLVGAIDSARLVAVCQDVQIFQTATDGGLPDSSVTASFNGVLEALRQPPRDPALARIAAGWATIRQRSGDRVVLARMNTFCTREGA